MSAMPTMSALPPEPRPEPLRLRGSGNGSGNEDEPDTERDGESESEMDSKNHDKESMSYRPKSPPASAHSDPSASLPASSTVHSTVPSTVHTIPSTAIDRPNPETPIASPGSVYSSSHTIPMHGFPSPPTHKPFARDILRDLDSVPDLPVSRKLRESAIPAALQQIRRKPLSPTASPIATRYSSVEYLAIAKVFSVPENRFSRSNSVDSPTVYEFPHSSVARHPGLRSTTKPQTLTANKGNLYLNESPLSAQFDPASVSAREEAKHSSHSDGDNTAGPRTGPTPELSQHGDRTSYADLLADVVEGEDVDDEDPLSDNILDGYNSDTSLNSNTNSNLNNSNTMSLHIAKKPIPPHLNLQQVDSQPDASDINTPNTDKPLPKSPSSSKLGNFFGWGSPSTSANSEKAFSPIPSPFNFSKTTSISDASPATTIAPHSLLGAPKAQYAASNSRDYGDQYLATPSASSYSPYLQIEEMEDELKAISAELASSIRREIDLEDLVDRLQTERDNPSDSNRRTSDYFSDSGYSSAKVSDYDQSREELEKVQRRAEQEKAQVRIELTNKLQEERSRRQQLDTQIQELSVRASQIDLAQANSGDASDRVKELESTCETLRRKLAEERQVKDNFEDLVTAMRGELQNTSNERDNLRDEIVPQLRARVEGLESQAAEFEKMTYESSKMQQELQSLKTENFNLRENHSRSMVSINEDDVVPMRSRPSSIIGAAGLSRSNSITSFRLQRPGSGLLRSKTVKLNESRDQLSERLKDVEEQRDALHRALKSLLERQEHQNRENEKKIKVLEIERDRLLETSPQKAGFQKEVSNLRAEINTLRRRSEEALEQKWQAEKGLAGLKMDLDRAEQEIASLRSLLDENDILIPPSLARSSTGSDNMAVPVTSESLTTAYEGLHKAYLESLERIKNLESSAPGMDDRAQIAMEKLERTLSSTVLERDTALRDASSYKEQLDALKASEQQFLQSEKVLADELEESARRVEELSVQVRQQLSINQNLRQRITDTVSRSESEQNANTERITVLQARLQFLEEKLDAAQNASEDRISRHEEEMQALKDSHNTSLSRMRNSLQLPRSPRSFPPKSPLSPLFTSPNARAPRLSSTRSGPAMSIKEESQIDNLRARIAELENALADADSEMEQVVSRMNTAQIQVLELQEEREAAVNRTRKLERELEAEKLKSFEERFKSLQT